MRAEHLTASDAEGDREGSGRRLNGWKEIGAFFQKNERTVKRWEQRGLPVHRLPGGANTAVFAFTGELEAWLKGGRGTAPAHESPLEELQPSGAPAEPKMPQPPRAWYRRPAAAAAALAMVVALALAVGFGALGPIGDNGREATAARHQPSAEAAQLYLSGIYHWNTRTAEGLKQSRDEFSRAIALDPAYAAAHAGLGNAYNLLAQYGVMKPGEAYPQARAAAEKAIALDPGLADGYSALAFALFYGFKDLRRSETLFQQALALDPKSGRTFHWYALVMMHTGKFDEPLRAITRAQELDPQSHAVRANRGLILFYAGRTDEAIAVLNDLTQSAPGFLAPHYYLATIYLDQQRYDDYLRESLKAAEVEGNAALKAEIEAGAAGYRAGGAKGLFAAMLAVQKSELAAGRETAFNVARTAALLGDRDAALASLEQSFAGGEPDLLGIRIDRSFRSLREDARFQKLADTVLDLR
ncbi:tetratricopeptide repeat protein [Dongia sp.]|uniref:tetratricopeptide repeat protein n=1 Tax=Dongia sp. TaxID=1977262 RepID=UPI0037525463